MSVDEISKLFDSVGRLIGAIIWPAAITFILVRSKNDISKFIGALGEFTIKGAGFEASAKRKQDEAGAALIAATVSRNEVGKAPVTASIAAREAVQVVGSVSSQTIRRMENSIILWVDDRPENNIYERQALEAFGIRVIVSKSTEDALEKLAVQRFDTVISDMGRPPDPRAGYTLLDRIRTLGNNVPYVIYAGSRSPEHIDEARRRGAVGCTNRATELFELVISALKA